MPDPMKLQPGAANRLLAAPSAQDQRIATALSLSSEFRAPEFAPGVVPKNDPQVQANDTQISSLITYAELNFPGAGFLGFPFLGQLTQIAEYRQISSRLAQEMTRRWIKFNSQGQTDKTERIKQLNDEFERLEVQAAFRTMAEYDGYFGRGQLYIDLGPKTKEELERPLLYDAAKIKKGDLKRLQPIEPMFSYPYTWEATNPLSRHFYVPEQWYVMNQSVHYTRLLTFVSRPLPSYLKPMYAFSGTSLSQLAMPTIENFLKMRQSISNITLNYSLRGIQTNLAGLLQGGVGELESIIQRLKVYVQQATNEGLLVLDKETEEFFQHSSPLTNLDKLLDQARDNMCAVANIPRMVLFGLSPEGMNATADGELKVFDQYIAGMQEVLFRHNLTKVMKLVQLSLWGEVDPDIVLDFVPLRELDEKEQAQVRNQNAQSDNIYLDKGVVSPDEARAKLANDPYSGWNNLDLTKTVIPLPSEAPNPTGAQPNTTE